MTGRIHLITGAASGIGAATAIALAHDGARLVLASRGADEAARDRLDSVADRCRARGAKAATVFADLSEPGAGARLVTAATERFGGLDVLVSNAGFAERGSAASVSRGALTRSFDAIAAAFADLLAAARTPLVASGRGAVVAVSSFVAHRFAADRPFAASAAAKAALEALVKTAAAELAAEGVTVNAVVPGYTRKDPGRHTAMTPEAWAETVARIPAGRLAEPDDVAALIAFLAGPGARYLTGQVIAVDGGLSL